MLDLESMLLSKRDAKYNNWNLIRRALKEYCFFNEAACLFYYGFCVRIRSSIRLLLSSNKRSELKHGVNERGVTLTVYLQ